MSEKDKYQLKDESAVVVPPIIFKLYRMLIKKIQVPKLMMEMIIVA